MSSFRDKFRRLRRTLSFRSRKKRSSKSGASNQNWENDSVTISQGGLSFPVKYLGSLEVSESRGTQVCSQAAHQMKMSAAGRKKQRVTLWVTEDTLRVIDDDTKSLVVDQVIEKVSFCTPDPHDEKLFSYICRDGTSRRWLCHSFRGIKDSGERISHAVGCAFAACLQKKQQQNQQNQNFQRGNSTRKTLEKRQNGVVLPTESVQIIQQINQEEYNERVQKAQASTTPSTTSAPSEQPAPPASPPSRAPNQAFARPRPSPGDSASFTRHMSLPYRTKKGAGTSSTYQALTDDPMPPRLPQSPPLDTSFDSNVVPHQNGVQPVSDADMWLTSVSAAPPQQANQNLLMTVNQPNPFTAAPPVQSQAVYSQQQAGWNAAVYQQPAPLEQKPNPFDNNWAQPTVQPVAVNANPFNGPGERFV